MSNRKRKYKTPEEAKAAARAQQAAYRAARKAGTWVRKNRVLSQRIAAKAGVEVGFDPKVGGVTEEAKAAAERAASARQQEQPEDWEEIVMPYLGSHEDETRRGKGRKLTPEEKRAAKTEWQRQYRELKRLAAGKPKRGRRKYATPEEAKEAARAYHRAYGKKYRALKKSGEWVPKSQRVQTAAVVTPVEPKKKGGRRSQFATEEERRAAKNEYNRKYHLLRKTGLWVRKNRVFSERVAKSAGLKTEKERLAEEMATPAKRLFGSEAEWLAALSARRGIQGSRKKTPEELREELRVYNREYRRRRRAEDLARKQQTWTAEEWEVWRAKEANKGRGNPAHFVKEVVKFLAETSKLKEEAVMAHLLEHGGVDFLTAGAEAIGKDRAKRPAMVKAAARAVAFYVDPDNAVMFPERA